MKLLKLLALTPKTRVIINSVSLLIGIAVIVGSAKMALPFPWLVAGSCALSLVLLDRDMRKLRSHE